MRTLPKSFSFFGALPLVLGLFCQSSGAGAPESAHVLRVYQSQDPITLDWTLSSSTLDSAAIDNLQDGLFRIDSHGQLQPALASSWSVSADGKIFRFHLRPRVVWSDGVPLTSQHFIDAWKRLLSPLTASPYAYLLFDVVGAEDFYQGKIKEFEKTGFRAPAPDTLEVQLVRPLRDWIWVMAFRSTFPVRSDLIAKHGNLWTKPGNLVNLGPYCLDSIDFGKSLILKRNPKYYGTRGNLDRIEFVIEPEEKLVSLFASGAIDMAFGIPAKAELVYAHRPELKHFPAIRTKRISFNMKQYPTSDLKVRQAIALALNKVALAKALGEDYAAAGSFVPPGLPGHSRSPWYGYDAAAAKKLIAASGNDAKDLKLSLLVPTFSSESSENMKVALWLRDSFQSALGIPLSLELVDDASQWAILSRSGGYSMVLHDWTADYPDPDNFYSIYSSRSKHNVYWKDADYDSTLEQARGEASSSKRDQLYRHADEILIKKNLVMLPLYYASERGLVSSRVHDFRPNPYEPFDFTGITVR